MASVFGVSKSTFLQRNILPAAEDDPFRNDKCAFCWGEYDDDDDHPAIRILPCNHVMGRPCLIENINNSSNGDLCMHCRAPLFRPPIPTMVSRWLASEAALLTHALLVAYVRLLGVWNRLPWLFKSGFNLLYLYYRRKDASFWVSRFLKHYTDFELRNPHIDTWNLLYWPLLPAAIISRITFTGPERDGLKPYAVSDLLSYDQAVARNLISRSDLAAVIHLNALTRLISLVLTLIVMTCVWHLKVKSKLHSKKDKWLFTGAVIAVTVLHHLWDLWVLARFHAGDNPYSSWVGQSLLMWMGSNYSQGAAGSRERPS